MKKILVVGEPASIHANRFILLLQQGGYDVRLFPASKIYYLEEHLENIKVYAPLYSVWPQDKSIEYISLREHKLSKFYFKFCMMMGIILLKLFGEFKYLKKIRARSLLCAVNRWGPDLIISLKLQNEGYLVNFAKMIAVQRGMMLPPWLHFCWGTDIEFYGKNLNFKAIHLPLIKSSLSNCDYLLSDSIRDSNQAELFGFRGVNLGYMLATGGFIGAALELRNHWPPKSRFNIIVKGREGGLVGRASNIVEAFKRIAPHLKSFEILFIMVSESAREGIKTLVERYELNCRIINRISYVKLIELFCKSRISISASDVDGTPGFLLESLFFGAFPIHSKMGSITDWIISGENGLTFDVNNIEELSQCILLAISDEALIESAFNKNRDLAKDRISRENIADELHKILEKIL